MMNGYRAYMGIAMAAALGLLGWISEKVFDTHDSVIMLHDDFQFVERDLMQHDSMLRDHEIRLRKLEQRP